MTEAPLSLCEFRFTAGLIRQDDYWILPEGYGYLLLRAEVDLNDMTVYPARILQEVREAVSCFIGTDVMGMIVDLRGNYGGLDELAADLSGFFYPEESFYEYLEIYDGNEGSFRRAGK